MKPARLSRTLHKWIALIACIQALLWVVSGFYMVVVDLDFIHGDSLVRNLATAPPRDGPRVTIQELRSRYADIEQVRIKGLPGFATPLYELTVHGDPILVDGVTGKQLSPLGEPAVESLARQYYAGAGGLERLTLLTSDAPSEIQSRPLPLWRADFDDRFETTLYIHPASGELVTRRHRYWRWFDFLWMLHIMDYESRENVNNPLLRVATGLGVALALSGLWLVYFRFLRRAPPGP
jgi:uncharacterized iron-regulated membrane protein